MTGVQTCALPICFPVTILFAGHLFQFSDDGPIMSIKISTRKSRKTGKPAGRPKGQGRGKRHNNDVPEMSINDMPEHWACLFGK